MDMSFNIVYNNLLAQGDCRRENDTRDHDCQIATQWNNKFLEIWSKPDWLEGSYTHHYTTNASSDEMFECWMEDVLPEQREL